MSLLTLDADRLVRDAVDAFVEGRARPEPVEDTMFATRNSRYRVVGGIVEEATDTSLMGAELVGWLVEQEGLVHVEPSWQPAARAIFVERTQSNHVVVTSRVLSAEVVATAREAVTTLSPRPRRTARDLDPYDGQGAGSIRVASSSVPPPEPEIAKRRSGKQSVIPPSPPIPQLKTNPSVAPAALVSLGPAPIHPSTAGIPTLKETPRDPKGSDDEITKVDHTEIHDPERLRELRELSAEIPVPPAARKSKAGPSTKPPARPSGRGSGRDPVIPPPPPTPLLGSGAGHEGARRPSRPPPPRPTSSRGVPRPGPRIEPPSALPRTGKLPPMAPPPSRPRRSK